VFTCDPARYASTEELKTYDEQIAQSQIPQEIRPEELPGPEALTRPGRRTVLPLCTWDLRPSLDQVGEQCPPSVSGT